MEYIWMALVGGAAAFPHCLGMCGGFALHLAGGKNRGTVFARQMLWHAGRTVTYTFLGALAGFLGNLVSLARWPFLRDVPGYLAGAIMLVMGLFVLGVVPTRRGELQGSQDEGLFASFFRQFFQKPSSLSALVLGLANGFLPCPITIGFLGLAAGSQSVLLGMGIMAAMGLGTVWALLILGMTGHAIQAKWKRWGGVLVGVLLIAMGTWTILRKAKVLPPIPGLHMMRRHSLGGVRNSMTQWLCRSDSAIPAAADVGGTQLHL
ncbi:MAG: sulfite exporter TauE/SafE family protein [Planctomycetota bacterium]|nr:sulfite exporter TauE/SafE family protein [Planctomycetota bacterium]